MDVRALATAYGVRVEIADLGDWAPVTLVAEYDPDGPAIRVNARALPSGSAGARRDALDRAIAHELYHHREAVGEIPRIAGRAARERAADDYADAMVGAERR